LKYNIKLKTRITKLKLKFKLSNQVMIE